jgi:ubiquinone/menaquinone biosynthesis C-methylase UbiE
VTTTPDPSYYDRVAAWSASPAHAAEMTALCRALWLSRGATVLDIGCGTGASLKGLRRGGLTPIGVDYPAAWIGVCSERPVARADAAQLPFRDASFDAATMMHSVAHLTDPAAALGEAFRVLRPGGKLGIVTPNQQYLEAMELVHTFTDYRPDPTVHAHYTRDELSELVRGAGFSVASAVAWGKLAWPVPVPWRRERLVIVGVKPK